MRQRWIGISAVLSMALACHPRPLTQPAPSATVPVQPLDVALPTAWLSIGTHSAKEQRVCTPKRTRGEAKRARLSAAKVDLSPRTECVACRPAKLQLCQVHWSAYYRDTQSVATVMPLHEDKIYPMRSGPRMEDRPPVGAPRSVKELEQTLDLRQSELSLCYRAARFRRPNATEMVRLVGEVAPLGEITLTKVVAETSGDTELSSCVREALTGLSTPMVTPRRTLFDLLIRFKPSTVAAPEESLKSPIARPLIREAACIPALTPLPEDKLAPTEPVLRLDDVGDYLAEEQWERQLRDMKRECQERIRTPDPDLPEGGRLFRNNGPPINSRTAEISGDWVRIRQDYLGLALRQNRGAYQECYAEAVARRPGLAGWALFQGRVDRAGNVTAKVKKSNLSDQRLLECLGRSLSQVWVHPWPQPLEYDEEFRFDYPLRLVASPLPEPDDLGKDPALTPTAAQRQPQNQETCGHRLQELAELLRTRPWLLFEPTLESALAHLPAALRSEPPDSECRALYTQLLLELATLPHKYGLRLNLPVLIERAMVRYPLLLAIAPARTENSRWRFWHAEALFKLGRYCQAAPVYQSLAAWPDMAKRRDASYAAVIAWRNCLETEWYSDLGSLDPHTDSRHLDTQQPTAIDPRLLQTIQDYWRVAPEDEETYPFQIKLLVRHGQCAAAGQTLADWARRSPSSEKEKYMRKWAELQCAAAAATHPAESP